MAPRPIVDRSDHCLQFVTGLCQFVAGLGRHGRLDVLVAAAHPKITFESTDVMRSGDDLTISGNLSIRGVARPVDFSADFNGPVTDPWGNPHIAADASGKINRTEWGLTWNQLLEAGELLVGEEVKFHISAQAVNQTGVAGAVGSNQVASPAAWLGEP